MPYDLIILGAGVSGLAAARKLSGKGLSVAILEARDRVGGRIHTKHDPHSSVPLELGAEFVHGKPAETFDLLHAAGLSVVDAGEERLQFQNGKLQKVDFWAAVEKVFKAVGRTKKDVSFFDALAAVGKKVDKPGREMALSFVEGFDAADVYRISVQSVIEEQKQTVGGDDWRNFRTVGGYDQLVEHMRAGFDPKQVQLHLNTVATSVRWSRGKVVVDTIATHGSASRAFEAGAVLVALPLGVLQASPGEPGAIAFQPPVPQKADAVSRLAAGPVVKILLRFRDAFWETETIPTLKGGNGPKNLEDVVFLHARGVAVPTWWTLLPVRSNLLTGWVGGNAAAALSGKGDAFILERALESLSTILGLSRPFIESKLEQAIVADWQTDPYARGAYSYVPVGGLDAREKLAAPVDDTLFFAGEATDATQPGTVAGAIAAGYRAADEIAKALA